MLELRITHAGPGADDYEMWVTTRPEHRIPVKIAEIPQEVLDAAVKDLQETIEREIIQMYVTEPLAAVFSQHVGKMIGDLKIENATVEEYDLSKNRVSWRPETCYGERPPGVVPPELKFVSHLEEVHLEGEAAERLRKFIDEINGPESGSG